MNYYGPKISFAEGDNNKLFVFSSHLSIADAINTAAKYKQLLKDQELIQSPETTVVQMLKRVSDMIVNDINKVNGIDTQPLNTDDVSIEKTKELIPASLTQLLTLLCNGGKEHKILSIAQIL